MLRNKQTKRNLAILLMAAAVLTGAGMATAQVSYHLVVIPDISGATAISAISAISVADFGDRVRMPQTRSTVARPKMPCGMTNSTPRMTMKAAASL